MGVPAVDGTSELISINGGSQVGDGNVGEGEGDYSAAPVMSLDDLVGEDFGAGREKGTAAAGGGFVGAGGVGTDEEKEMEFMLQMSSVQHKLDAALAENEALKAEIGKEREAVRAEREKEREAMRAEREELARKLEGEILLKEAATASVAEVMKKMEGDAVERRKVGAPNPRKNILSTRP
jgi:hypothetical protein